MVIGYSNGTPKKIHQRSRLIRGAQILACVLDKFGSHILQEALAHRERDLDVL